MVRIFWALKVERASARDQARELLRALLGPGALQAGCLALFDERLPLTAELARPPLELVPPKSPLDAAVWLSARRDPYLVAALRHDPAAPRPLALPTDLEDPMQASLDTILFLKDVPLFEGLTTAQLVEVARLAEPHALAAGAVLFHQGDAVDFLYIVRRGGLSVKAGSEERARLGPGECVGEMAVLTASERTATVETVEATQLLRFDADDFLQLLDNYPEIGRSLLRALVRRLAKSMTGARY
jgi:hypothetical protein